MSRAGADWQIHLYGGVTHSFTNPEADKVGKPEMLRYDRNADARSWASMCAFLRRDLRGLIMRVTTPCAYR